MSSRPTRVRQTPIDTLDPLAEIALPPATLDMSQQLDQNAPLATPDPATIPPAPAPTPASPAPAPIPHAGQLISHNGACPHCKCIIRSRFIRSELEPGKKGFLREYRTCRSCLKPFVQIVQKIPAPACE